VATYDAAAGVWRALRRALGSALALTGRPAREAMPALWAAQQRFFKLLCVSLKARSRSSAS
jgi:hypothetical protein